MDRHADPPTTGTYAFAFNSDDGSRLVINGQTVVNNWFNQPPTTRTGQIALTAASHRDCGARRDHAHHRGQPARARQRPAGHGRERRRRRPHRQP
jgi:PA14 domain-containing protein